MSFWNRNRRTVGDTELDQWVKGALDAELAEMDTAFDFDAGLADVYARAGLTRPATTGSRPVAPPVIQPSATAAGPEGATDRGNDSGDHIDDFGPVLGTAELTAVQAVIDHIGMLDTLLAAITRAEGGPMLPISYLVAARQFLLQLRTGLSARRLSHHDAYGLIRNVAHDLRLADEVLRRQHGLSLEQAMHDRIGEIREINTDMTQQLELLEEKVRRLFDQADDPVLIPTPR